MAESPTYEPFWAGTRDIGDGVTSFGVAPNTVICSDCSALVLWDREEQHTDWHRRVKKAAMGFPLGKQFGGL